MKRLALIIVMLLGFCSLSGAKIILSPLYGDGMVLQQQSETIIAGYASGKELTVTIPWVETPFIVPVKNGKFEVAINTPVASRQSYSMTFKDKDSEVVLKDVLVGDVWICSGQSNMEMTMKGYNGQPIKHSVEMAMQSAKYSDLVHMFTVGRCVAEKPRPTVRGTWRKSSPENVMTMSATAYCFAVALADALQIPIGIISASRSSSKIEVWMPQDLLKEKHGYDVEKINSDANIRDISKCGLYYNGMIAPLFNYKAKGFLWYQGESNRDNPEKYPELLASMVNHWRTSWGDTENRMPFVYVQIAPYRYTDKRGLEVPVFVEAQSKALEIIPNSAMTVTTDIGEMNCIHPSDKKTVGQRAAIEAMRLAYGVDITNASGMRPIECVFAEGKVDVSFSNASYGFMPVEPVYGFELAGADGVFYAADAVIVKNKPVVTVSSLKVTDPVTVRYAYRNYPGCNLVNTLGFPAYPFSRSKE